MKQKVLAQNLAIVGDLNPGALWAHFATLCETPRDSKNEEAIADKIVALAREKGFIATKDEMHNVLVVLPASEGFEHLQLLCLQSHIDMVCEKNPDVEEMFPIELVLEGNILRANGTTLGADNGIGAAAMMALISHSTIIPHGSLELLFTTVEEIGLVGAEAFDYSVLKSKKILNLDSEEEGIFFVGCAGGARMNGFFKPNYIEPSDEHVAYSVELSGFPGGHSGIDIGLDIPNAIKILVQILGKFVNYGMCLADFSGGSKMNAIPREAKATIMLPKDATHKSINLLGNFPIQGLSLVIKTIDRSHRPEKMMDKKSTEEFLTLITRLPHGAMNTESGDSTMVRTSNNIGVVETKDGAVNITCMYRSSLNSELEAMEALIKSIFTLSGAQTELSNKYFPWEPQFDTDLLKFAVHEYSEMFNTKPKLMSIHAGLECAVFYKSIPEVQIVSFGPEMGGVHTPNEWVKIDSVERFWNFLLKLITSS